MDIELLDNCFKDWLNYKHFKKRDWPDLRNIYHQELGGYREIELSEALGRLFAKTDDFPTIRLIKQEIALRNETKTEGGGKDYVIPHLLEANLHMEAHLGFWTNPLPIIPNHVIDIAERAAVHAMNNAEGKGEYELKRVGFSALVTLLRDAA